MSAAPSTAAADIARRLDERMGDPHDVGLKWSYHEIVQRDEREAVDLNIHALVDDCLDDQRLSRAELIAVARTIGHHDPGAALDWACSAAARMCVGQTSDVGPLAIALPIDAPIRASEVASGFLVSGECPLALNLERAPHVLIVSSDGRRFILDAQQCASSARVRTVGLRTAVFGEWRGRIVVNRTRACASESTDGAGLFYLAAAAVSLGVADTVLRAVIDFARDRRAYGQRVLDIPHAQSLLSEAASHVVAAERVLDDARQELAAPRLDLAWYLVTHHVKAALAAACVVFGARGYCRRGHWHGIVEKLVRDHMVLRAYPATPAVVRRAVLFSSQVPECSHG